MKTDYKYTYKFEMKHILYGNNYKHGNSAKLRSYLANLKDSESLLLEIIHGTG
jgi:hypothetical protein